MKTILNILFVLTFCIIAKAQPFIISQKLRTIQGNYVSFSLDNLDNIYLISASNQLKKLNAQGDSVSVFNNIKKFGETTLVDLSNPVKILLYYKGFSTIAILDGMLNLKNTIDLRKKNMQNVTAVGLAYDGRVWVYDDMDNVLKKIDDEGNLIFKTTDFRQLFDKAISPVKVFDQNKFVYLYDPLQGIYIFDYYGAYKSKIDITGWRQLFISGQYIYGTNNENLYRYNITTFKYDDWPIPSAFKEYQQLFFRSNKLYALSKQGLEIYSLH